MENKGKTVITVKVLVNAPVERVWNCWTNPEHIVGWNFASSDWHSPRAKNDLRPGGQFTYRMEARDGSIGFDFYGTYDVVIGHEKISSTLGDDRRVDVVFRPLGNSTELEESFETENINSVELQRTGWQAILNNFKKYVESQKKS